MSTLADLKIMSYQLLRIEYEEIRLERMEQDTGPDLWAIRKGSSCLGKKGQWEFEPSPSSRDYDFFARFRFTSAEEALTFWESGPKQARIEYHAAMARRSQAA